MAGEDRTASHVLMFARTLDTEPYHFDFFQAVRRIECLNRDKKRLGCSQRPSEDPIRLAQEPFLTFAPSTLAAFYPATDKRPARLAVRFLGLFGPNGPLPMHLTEYAYDRLHNAKDPTFSRFLDIFHHRLLSLFYRAWASAQPTVSLDRPESDRFAVYVGSLFGIGMPALRERDAVPDLAKLHFAGQLVGQTRHPAGLSAILREFFRLPVAIREFIGHWLELPKEGRLRLGETPETGALGVATIIGSRVWSCQSKFRIVIGPIGLKDYLRMLPGGDSLRRLVAWVRNYAGDAWAWDVNLILKKEEVPALVLGQQGRLGWTTWVTSRDFTNDADDLRLNPMLQPGRE